MSKIKILVNCPIPIEFKAAKNVFSAQDTGKLNGCKIAEKEEKNYYLFIVQSGPGKTRTAQAVTSLIMEKNPDLIIDTGTCAGIQPGLSVGDMIIGKKCIEFDISGYGIPVKRIKEMELVSLFHFLPSGTRDILLQTALGAAQQEGYSVYSGFQACGEFLINSNSLREKLYELFHVSGSNWETAGVFISALRSQIPVFSLRVISDMGNKNALREFLANAKKCSMDLYNFLKILIENGWSNTIVEEWKKLPDSVRQKAPKTVLPGQ
ncbi:MAG: 5'-methylthioadenosine/S-adenosylhomocysteine nucleosidase [Spirochaetales bacterium]|nr:5'-methylthioadenosine/S-adenosylhomocysteine nucleosidase [Spirochaetales bacterium]